MENVMKKHEIKCTDTAVLTPKLLSSMPAYKPVFISERFDEKRIKVFVVFDTETTGLDPEKEGIVQLSAIRYENGTAQEVWNTYLNPECPISESAASVNGISEEMVKDAPKLHQVAADFLAFVKDLPVAGYNVRFDFGFLWCKGIDLISGRDIYDVMLSAYGILPKGAIPNRRLTTVAEALGIQFDAHDSLEDSRATGDILVRIAHDICHGSR